MTRAIVALGLMGAFLAVSGSSPQSVTGGAKVSGFVIAKLEDGVEVVAQTTEAEGAPGFLAVVSRSGQDIYRRQIRYPVNPTVFAGAFLACGTADGLLVVNLRTFEEQIFPAADLFAVDARGRVLGYRFDSRELRVSDTPTLSRIRRLDHHPRRIEFAPDGTALILDAKAVTRWWPSSDRTVSLFAAPEGAELRDLEVGGDQIVVSVRHRDGRRWTTETVALSLAGEVLRREPGPSMEIPTRKMTPRVAGGIPWPLEPDSQHPIGNTWGEFQDGVIGGPTDPTAYLHPGIDILGSSTNQPVYAVADGTVKAVLTTGGAGNWRVAIGDCPGSQACSGYLYAHLKQSTILVNVGDSVNEGDQIGELYSPFTPSASFDHLHFARIAKSDSLWGNGQWYATENPLLSLSLSESSAPVFEPAVGSDKFAFCINNRSTYLDADELEGQVDIIAHVSDSIGSVWECTVQELRYTIYPLGLPQHKIVNNKLSVYYDMSLDAYLNPNIGYNDQLLMKILYKRDATCPTEANYTDREFFHVLTNSNGDTAYTAADTTAAWDTSLLPDRSYVIRVTASDANGNAALDSMTVTTVNRNPTSATITTNVPGGQYKNFRALCPQGTVAAAESLIVTVDFDGTLPRDVAASELTLVRPSSAGFKFWKIGSPFAQADTIPADSAATSANGYRTTFTHRRGSGCGGDSLLVLWGGVPIGKAGVRIRSFDFLPASAGNVDASDLSAFAAKLGTCTHSPVCGAPPTQPCCLAGYDSCFDLAVGDSLPAVDASDLSYFASHLGHGVPASKPRARTTASSGTIVFVHDPLQPDRIAVRLEDVESSFTAVGLVAQVGVEFTEDFLSWTPNPSVSAYSVGVRNDHDALAMVIVSRESSGIGSVDLGSFRFDRSASTADFEITFGEAVNEDGEIRSLRGASKVEARIPTTRLEENVPNPFNPTTTIQYTIAEAGDVHLAIFDMTGRHVRNLVREHQVPGRYTIEWNGSDERGGPVASGIYVASLRTREIVGRRKLVLVR